jgi:predicted ATPase
MIEKVVGGKPLPAEVVQQIVAKTDGVPLFVEELTKMVLESGLLTETNGHYELRGPLPPLAIPPTLQDSLMARLDRLATTKKIAQLGATIGREFSYELLHALSPLDEQTLQHGLHQLVGTELIYQRGTPPHATYLFKHALIQDTAYQSLLKSTRQQYHQQVAKVLAERFPETKDTQPELLAHHYTEAGLLVQAIPCWQQAGQRAVERSANVEATSHLTKGLELLTGLPETPERTQQELDLLITLGPSLIATKGYATPEVKHTYSRAQALCQQLGETSQLPPVLWGLWVFSFVRAELQTAHEFGQQLLHLASRLQDPTLLLEAHIALGGTLFHLGEFAQAREHLKQGVTLYDARQHHSAALLYGGQDPGVLSLSYMTWVLWFSGYADQALKRIQEALSLAQRLSHPYSLAVVQSFAAIIYQLCREGQAVRMHAEQGMALSAEQGFSYWPTIGSILRGWALVEEGQWEKGIVQMHEGIEAHQIIGTELDQGYFLILLAEGYGKSHQAEQGLALLAKALDGMRSLEDRYYEAELYRLRGELTLQKGARDWGLGAGSPSPQAPSLKPQDPTEVAREAEECFLKAIEVAQKQQAKSLELRAVVSLARLRQRQAQDYATHSTQHETRIKLDEAQRMLSEVYKWFTEGFDTRDLQEAKTLLEELSP